MEIGFYHLTASTLEQALPKLLARVLAVPGRAMVLGDSAERMAALDTTLWRAEEWLPHNAPGAAAGDGDASLQPIWLTVDDEPAPNAARHLFLVGGAQSGRLDEFDRCFDLFDGMDEAAVQAARGRFRQMRDAGHTLTYWQQNEAGRWEKRA